MHLMQRINTFIIEGSDTLWELADKCSKLYNELNYERHTSITEDSNGILSICTGSMLLL